MSQQAQPAQQRVARPVSAPAATPVVAMASPAQAPPPVDVTEQPEKAVKKRWRPIWMDGSAWDVMTPEQQGQCADCSLKTTWWTLLTLAIPPALITPFSHNVFSFRLFKNPRPVAYPLYAALGAALYAPLNTYHAVRARCAPDGYMGSYLPALRGEKEDGVRWIDSDVWRFMTPKERYNTEKAGFSALMGAGVLNGALAGGAVWASSRIVPLRGRLYTALAIGLLTSIFAQPYTERVAGAVLAAPHGYLMHYTLSKYWYKLFRPKRGDPSAPVD